MDKNYSESKWNSIGEKHQALFKMNHINYKEFMDRSKQEKKSEEKIVFLDFKKAFQSISHYAIYINVELGLRRGKCPEDEIQKIIEILKFLYNR